MRASLNDALIVVDMQNDFCPGGALAVQGGDEIVPLINRLIPKFDQVIFTRDWHPANHVSFSDTPEFRDKSWPAHCVANTPGAAFCSGLEVPQRAMVVDKGGVATMEAYSGFEGTNLADELDKRGVERIFVCGLATDYCVKSTALDGVRRGFEVIVLHDACRGVDNPLGSVEQAIQQMRDAGVQLATSQAFQ